MIATTSWNAVDHLDGPEAIAAYLDAALEDSDPGVFAAAIGDVAQAKGMSAVAEKAGVTLDGLRKALSRDGKPELATILKVMKVLGFRLSAFAA